jgi:heme-degrading monooxygenase HmoA
MGAMHHVIFEVLPAPGGREPYLATAARLRPMLDAAGGCLALERFDRDDGSGWVLSMQRWSDAAALARWRLQPQHGAAQASGRAKLFADYRLRVAARLAGSGTRPEVADAPAKAVEVGADGDPARARAAGRALAILEWTGAPDPAGLAEPAGSRRYTSLLDATRHAIVTANGPGDVLWTWALAAGAALRSAGVPYAASLAEVERDYGMVDRHEAPGVRP